MDDLAKSDTMVCNTRANNIYKQRKENDTLFLQQMNNTQPTRLRDFRAEFDLLSAAMNPRKYTCNDAILSRGANVTSCGLNQDVCVGWDCYNAPYHAGDFLMYPCKDNTWRNHIECDATKCCSIKHQLYMNNTKRK